MDDVVNRLARELAEAMAAAIPDDPRVEACREKARNAGFEMRVKLEAVVGFVNRPAQPVAAGEAPVKTAATSTSKQLRSKVQSGDMTANDRRFLRSLRIAAEDPSKEKTG